MATAAITRKRIPSIQASKPWYSYHPSPLPLHRIPHHHLPDSKRQKDLAPNRTPRRRSNVLRAHPALPHPPKSRQPNNSPLFQQRRCRRSRPHPQIQTPKVRPTTRHHLHRRIGSKEVAGAAAIELCGSGNYV